MAKATTASATAAEKDAEKVQAVENTTTEEKAGKYAVGNSKADLHWTEPAKSNAAMQQDF